MTIIKPTSAAAEIITNFIGNDEKKFEKLSAFVDMVLQENEKHNLIGRSTIPQIWTRHIIDSLQLVPYLQDSNNITDLGSGAGFPAIVLGVATDKRITMIEKSPVKAEFLKNTCKSLGLSFDVVNQAINIHNSGVIIPVNTTITSRAFTSLYNILLLANHLPQANKILLLKGNTFYKEMKECDKKNDLLLKYWTSSIKKSITNQGVVICMSKLK